MPTIKSNAEISERLLSIDWGQESARQRKADQEVPDVKGQDVQVRVDEVFSHINAYRAIVEAGVAQDGMLARSLIQQANAVFNDAFANLERQMGFRRVFVDSPVGNKSNITDITEWVINEVESLQSILEK